MNSNADELKYDNSNEHHKQYPEKKLHNYEQEWPNYQINLSPHFTPSQFLNPTPNLPPFNLEKSVDDPQVVKKYPFRKLSANDPPQNDAIEDDPQKLHYPHYGYYQPPPQMRYPQMYVPKYPMPPPPYWYRQHQYIPPFYYPQFDGSQYQNTLSKELQSKVGQLVSFQKVSPFTCNCKKSKCLKLYCECFANNWVCSQNCNCCECKNRIDNPNERSKAIEEALLRNPEAFAAILTNNGQQPQVVQEEKSQKEQVKDSTARKGCNCKKSECKKKYCECYSINQKCTDLCKCENCLNKNNDEENAMIAESKENKDDIKQQSQSEDLKIKSDVKKLVKKSKTIKKNKNIENNESGSEMQVVQVNLTITQKQKKKKKN